jgi:hypothetical protein
MVNVNDHCCCQPDEINRIVFNLCELKKILVSLVMDKRASIAKRILASGSNMESFERGKKRQD